MRKIIVLSAVFSLSLSYTYSQQGLLDPSFGNNGITRTDFGSFAKTSSKGEQVLTQGDGTIYVIIVTGGAKIARLLRDGTIDKSYGNKGYSQPVSIIAQDYYYYSKVSAAIQEDNKIVLAVTSYNDKTHNNFKVVRFKTNGTLDSSFSEDGIQETDFFSNVDIATGIAIQHDGKIVVAGYVYNGDFAWDFALARYNTDGSLDTTFSNDGKQTSDFSIQYPSYDIANSLVIQTDGKIVVAGSTSSGGFTIVRYDTKGSPDSTFSDDGIEITAFADQYWTAQAVALQADGKIVVAGGANIKNQTKFAVARYNTNGKLDSTFSGDGTQITDLEGVASSVAIQADGKIILSGGSNYDFAAARYDTDGNIDTSFSGDGKVTTDFGPDNDDNDIANSLAIQSDGKIVLAGSANASSYDPDFALARYNANGSLDPTFSEDGKLVGNEFMPYTVYTATAVQKDGKVVAAGYAFTGKSFDFVLARYDSSGSLDTTFSGDGKQSTDLSSGNDLARSVVIQADGKIVVGGSSGGNFALARYNTDGSLDTTFAHKGKQTTHFNSFGAGLSLALQNNGKIVLAGYAYTDSYDFALARYNSDGTLDKTFSKDGKQTTDLGVYDSISAVAIQDDGKIVVAGSVTSSHDYSRFAVVRYNADGSLDNSFSEDGKQIIGFDYYDDFASSIAIQKDKKIVVTGSAVIGYEYPDNYDFALARFNSDGALDSTFSNDGKLSVDFGASSDKANSVVIQKDGKILAGGTSGDNFALLRVNTSGTADSTFSYDGTQVTELGQISEGFNDIAIYGDKLYAVGETPYAYLYQGDDYDRSFGSIGAVARYFLGGNILPTVSITTPSNNAIYIAPARIKINVSASDTDGTVSKVDFYNGKTLIHTETLAPYGHKWTNVPAGNYVLTAKVTDNGGLVTTSDSVHISVIPAVPNKAPTVSITTPANHKTFPGPATIHLEAAAKDPDGAVAKVEFYNGSTLLATDYAYPYTYAWKKVVLGAYSVTAKATDNDGAVTTSEVVNVSVVPNITPTVIITNPANNESFTTDDTIPLVAFAKDPDGKIAKVDFYNGKTLIRTEFGEPYRYFWPNLSAGTYTITAKATDNYGAQSISLPVTITVAGRDTVIVSKKASISNKAISSNPVRLKLAPNPANNILSIYTEGLQPNKQATISVIGTSGVVIKTMLLNSVVKAVQLDVSSLVNGVYTIKLISGNNVLYKQFVKL